MRSPARTRSYFLPVVVFPAVLYSRLAGRLAGLLVALVFAGASLGGRRVA